MNQPDINTILFDLGGVIVDVRPVVQPGSASPRLDPDNFHRSWFYSPAARLLETGRLEPLLFAERFIREFQLQASPQELLSSFASWPRGLYPGAMHLLQRIPARFRRATMSNTNALHWPRLMKEMGLEGVFDEHFPSHLTGKAKPDADAFLHVICQLKCEPTEILFLDDNLANVDAARGIEIKAVHVCGIREAESALAQAGIQI